MIESCSSCGAPTTPTQVACVYCGCVLRTPASVEDEMALVRQQADAATQIATSKRNTAMSALTMGTTNTIENFQTLAQYWGTAFVPTTVPALVSALNLCAAGVPSATANGVGTVRALVTALATRAEVLETVLARHPEATAADRETARRVRELLDTRVRETDAAGRKEMKWLGRIGLAYAVIILGIPLLILGPDCVKSPAALAEDHCRNSYDDEKLTGCIEACGSGVKWACELAETLKQKSPAANDDE